MSKRCQHFKHVTAFANRTNIHLSEQFIPSAGICGKINSVVKKTVENRMRSQGTSAKSNALARDVWKIESIGVIVIVIVGVIVIVIIIVIIITQTHTECS